MADFVPKVEQCDLAAMVKSLTPTQRQVYDWTAEKLLKGEHMADGSHQFIAGRCQLSG